MITRDDMMPPPVDRGLSGFAQHLRVNLGDCDLRVVRSQEALEIFAKLLAEKVGMETYKGPVSDHFGHDDYAGWTVYQRITTSNIIIHANDLDASVFVDLISCKAFDADLAALFIASYLRTDLITYDVCHRVAPHRVGKAS